MTLDDVARRMRDDLRYYAQNNLKVKPKVGDFMPFVFNKAQAFLHAKLEEQRKKIGKVRAVILKGRQQGCSTYVGGRFYHSTTMLRSTLTFIFAHDSEASDSLFNMVRNFHEQSDPQFQPALGATNAKELLFPGMKSGYKVGTAGTKGLGRSKTFQRVHWSEVAYSPHAEDHASGILETVADEPGTEIILESTSAGPGDFFYRKCMEALSGMTDWILIFIPWFWEDGYTRPLPEEGFALDEEEAELLELHGDNGLTLEHLHWRRHKIAGYHGDKVRFMREYPCTPQEAFMASDENSLIKAAPIIRARKTPAITSTAQLVIGVDPARYGKNRIAMTHRKGRTVTKVQRLKPMNIPELANALAQEINKYRPAKMFIDVGGLGIGVYDLLVAMGFGKVVVAVNFGGDADNKDLHCNKRCEMYARANEWLNDAGGASIAVEGEIADTLQSELTSVQHHKHADIHQRTKLESKEDMLKRGIPSPDVGDSFVLTFAQTLPSAAVTDSLNRFAQQQMNQGQTDFDPFNSGGNW